MRRCEEQIASKRCYGLVEKAFKVLICPEFYHSKEPRELEVHEFFKIQRSLRALKGLTIKKMDLREKADQIKLN